MRKRDVLPSVSTTLGRLSRRAVQEELQLCNLASLQRVLWRIRYAVQLQKFQLGVPLISLYVRLSLPELDCCTRKSHAGAAIEVRASGVDGHARERYTQSRVTRNELFVTLLCLPRMHLAE